MSTSVTAAERNSATVQALYEAFGRGDIPAVLATLDDAIAWDVFDPPTAAQDAGVPYLQPRRGTAEVGGFFEALAAMEFGEFTLLDVTAGGDKVFAEIRIQVTSRATGRSLVDHEIHAWEFGPDGRIVRLRHFADTAKHVAINA